MITSATQDRMSRNNIPIISELDREMPTNARECRVRIWSAKGRDKGHASLATSKYYSSLIPVRDKNKNFYFSLFDQYDNTQLLSRDIENGGHPDFVIRFFTLNIELIEKSINSLWEKKAGWACFGGATQDGLSALITGTSWMPSTSSSLGWIIGDILIESVSDETHTLKAQSCVSAVLLFLMAGGIEKLNPGYTKTMKKAIKTPAMMTQYLIAMRKAEREKYPDTAGSDLEQAAQRAPEACNIL